MAVKERIRNYLKFKGVSQRDFAESVGLSSGYIGAMKKSFQPETMNNIAIHYPDLNTEWLLTGKGEMIKNGDAENAYLVNQQHQGKPYYDVDFINGFDLVDNDQSRHPAYHINFPQYNNADFWVNATGDSMKPLINHGDIVALRKIEDWATYMLFGEIYAFVTEKYRTIKRVRKSEKGDAFLRFEPLNTIEYDEQDVPVAAIRAVFQVIGCAKKIF